MPQPEKAATTPPAVNATVRTRRILVIDDGDSVRDIIRIFLEKDGFEVCGEAADGVEAVEQAKKLKPDLIVLDLAMPRVNGVEAASILSTTMPASASAGADAHANHESAASGGDERRQALEEKTVQQDHAATAGRTYQRLRKRFPRWDDIPRNFPPRP
jgi:CheY-like chemotaxis protein